MWQFQRWMVRLCSWGARSSDWWENGPPPRAVAGAGDRGAGGRARRGWAEERRRPGLAGGGGGGAVERSTPRSHGRSSRQSSALAEATATRSVSAGGAGWRAGDRRVRPSPRSPRGATRPGRHILLRVTFENLGTAYRSARRPGRRCVPSSQAAKPPSAAR